MKKHDKIIIFILLMLFAILFGYGLDVGKAIFTIPGMFGIIFMLVFYASRD